MRIEMITPIGQITMAGCRPKDLKFKVGLCLCGCQKPICSVWVIDEDNSAIGVQLEPDDFDAIVKAYKDAGYAALVMD